MEKKRGDIDLIKLIERRHEVHINRGLNEFNVKFFGPKETPYEGGVWRVRVELPDKYPFKSPSVGFVNKIFHPNIDEASGSVCLDVINQAWAAVFDLTNIFDTFLPHLLAYPNPSDPLNGDAAALYLHKQPEYSKRVREYIDRYATEDIIRRMDRGNSEILRNQDGEISDSTISEYTSEEISSDDEDDNDDDFDIVEDSDDFCIY